MRENRHVAALKADLLFTGARLATMAGRAGLGVVEDAVVAVADGRIAWAGARGEAPPVDAAERFDCAGRWITPGLVDCHTHLVFAGNRADEFARRLAGESYADIARSGGGIAATVRATRAADEDALIAASLMRLDALLAEGVTTVEIKSGYGLDEATELRQLRVARQLAARRAVSVAATYLGAHAVPPGGDRAAYLDLVCERMIPRIAAEGLADAVDVFQEGIAFSAEECARVFAAAGTAGLRVKSHADQLSDGGGAALAAAHRALSADHLEYTNAEGAAAMVRAGTVAVLLPGATLMLKEERHPPVDAFRAAGTRMAVATDLNPGSSPIASLRVCGTLACVLFRMTVEEVLRGITIEAAHALGRADRIGSVEAGKDADLAVWSVETLSQLVAQIGPSPLFARFHQGVRA
ncbi:imidazolonepropionase [Roseomonas terrae]|uniref:Imidazolonepropionase n=1 Tax=Neoroseomonas terrae TaxID=424799 RepID=A0ABS5ECZ8_9PROT|nr:imidazolonepropionase [Neoroseomonas terrae]